MSKYYAIAKSNQQAEMYTRSEELNIKILVIQQQFKFSIKMRMGK